MPITVELIQQGRVAVQTYSDPLDMHDIDELRRYMQHDVMEPAAEKVHIISDFRQVHQLPTFILTRGTSMLDQAHPNTGTIVVVFGNAIVSRMARAFIRMVPRKTVRIAATMDEAMAQIEGLRARESVS
jgi:hypothetical protein